MTKEQKMVEEFHRKFGGAIATKPLALSDISAMLIFLRRKLIKEEARELEEELVYSNRISLVPIAKEMADLLYVVYGTAVSLGIDLEPIFEAVHKSNMTKNGAADGSGKILKGDSYVPPDVESILIQQGGK
jgi:predicted HAD superfamily Cof-like phosphohydrolase